MTSSFLRFDLYGQQQRSFTEGSLTTSRTGHTVAFLPNGKAVSLGYSTLAGWPVWCSAELHNPVATRLRHTATLANRPVYRDRVTAAELYDPCIDTFAVTGPMATTRHSQTAALVKNSEVSATGGDAARPGQLHEISTGASSQRHRNCAAK